MITARIDKEALLKSIYSEEELAELSLLESFYAIRSLKALVCYGEEVLTFHKYNSDMRSGYVETYEIYVPIKDVSI